MDFLRHVVLAREIGLFEVWLLLGALLAAPVFASSVVAIPMLVDTSVPVSMAVAQSWRCVADTPVAHGAVGGGDRAGDGPRHAHRDGWPDCLDSTAGPRQLARLLRPDQPKTDRSSRAGPVGQRLTPCKPRFSATPKPRSPSSGLTFGVGAFILYMLFIVLNMALESKAGKFGTFILFLVLSFGMLGFVAKNIIQWVLGI